MAPRYVDIEGRRLDLVAMLVHSVILFAYTFLITFPAATVAGVGGEASAKVALYVASFAAGIKTLGYLAARTGTPIDGSSPPPSGPEHGGHGGE